MEVILMFFISLLAKSTLLHHSEMSLKEPSERELISRRIAARKRVQRKRKLLRMGLAKTRKLWKGLKRQ